MMVLRHMFQVFVELQMNEFVSSAVPPIFDRQHCLARPKIFENLSWAVVSERDHCLCIQASVLHQHIAQIFRQISNILLNIFYLLQMNLSRFIWFWILTRNYLTICCWTEEETGEWKIWKSSARRWPKWP